MAGGGSAEEFVFNWRLLENFNAIIREASEGVTVKCICGYFGSISYRDFQVALISRRSWRYAGTRYNRRGASVDGDAANFVETEQIVYDSARKTSFVITRGSIPLLWKQFPAFWYAPKILLTRNSDVLQKHYDKMIERYKNVFFVNLICVKGGEAEICRVFNDEMARIQIKNLHFNFKEKKIAYLAARRDEFFKDIAEKMNTFGFTSDKEQNGVMRINCIDSIDRTNMVQFLICQEILGKQIAHLHLKCAPDETFFQKYEIIWIHNGDALARQYTDTRALKSYALRTPRINIAYMLRDKAVSLERHLKCLFTQTDVPFTAHLFLSCFMFEQVILFCKC
ncbi:Phosphatidylinositide phosphatase SAC1 [Dictyocoela roeselum]|nr:Phosphatidylinositide phosphatase SAC1 [Dictyocoela roeselum]